MCVASQLASYGFECYPANAHNEGHTLTRDLSNDRVRAQRCSALHSHNATLHLHNATLHFKCVIHNATLHSHNASVNDRARGRVVR